jgi:uncharacterized protein
VTRESDSGLVAPPAGRSRPTPVGSAWHTAILVLLLLGLAFAQHQRRPTVLPHLTPVYVGSIVYEWVLVGYVWFFGLRRRGVRISEIVGGKWRRGVDFLIDFGIALGFWAIVLVVLGSLSYLLHFSGEEAAKFLLPRTTLEMVLFVLLACCAGFCEEIVFRGYLQRQFLAWTGSVVAGVGLQAVVFGAAHLYQGGKAVVVISVYGAMFGTLAAWRKNLRPGMMQHAGQDIASGLAGSFLSRAHSLHLLRF